MRVRQSYRRPSSPQSCAPQTPCRFLLIATLSLKVAKNGLSGGRNRPKTTRAHRKRCQSLLRSTPAGSNTLPGTDGMRTERFGPWETQLGASCGPWRGLCSAGLPTTGPAQGSLRPGTRRGPHLGLHGANSSSEGSVLGCNPHFWWVPPPKRGPNVRPEPSFFPRPPLWPHCGLSWAWVLGCTVGGHGRFRGSIDGPRKK